MTDTTYTYLVKPANETASDWLVNAAEGDLQGTLEGAQELAGHLDSEIELQDAAGFARGTVQPDGSYSLR